VSAAPFQLLGGDHLLALAITAGVAAGLCALVRRDPEGALARVVARGLAGALVAGVLAFVAWEVRRGSVSPLHLVPLHLCDLLIPVAVVALLSRRQLPFELLYFWGGAGAVAATFTPMVAYGFPDAGFVVFFGFHGAVIAAAALLAFGLGMQPRPGSALRVWGITAAYALAVAVANAALGTNFMFLRHKPPNPTLLDWFGPWPVYIGVAAVVALLLFGLLTLPFRGRGD
jgi:hypothetical integral membrane protein (TIGR02206 family)